MAVRHHQALRGVLLENEPMARHTTWRVGGPAERYYQPADIADLAQFLAALPGDEPVFWVGLGSNLLVRDGGIRGTVIATSGLLNGIGQVDAVTVRVEAGVSCAKVARFCARLGLTGAEFLAGIPGTMGGALAMNAGAFGGETWRLVRAVETLDRNGQLRERSAADYSVGYRAVQGPEGEWFVAAVLELAMGDTDAAAARIRELLDKRAASQPTQQPNAGSVFRNPPDDYAARLIESCGLKGRCVGSACVSTRHANFIVNTGGASAADIEALIELVAATVQQQSGVSLVREVHIVGEESGG
ncbi:MAG: UDP-N-acetylenolpyruvoylglucosamine reductase [Gammaproteobacteria bacterium HGW-Gammaproteobacteria-1]|nr:MAG: UDP-N-acetylenolpyruvoylglucosamine reductase [Gammaproteobacteria bacterium HGW-Gammaproteobacteria-1]